MSVKIENILKRAKPKKVIIIGETTKPRHEDGAIYWPIVWVETNRENVFMGICCFTRKICKVRELISALIVRDTIIEKEKCEEGSRCLNFKCQYNKTTPNSYFERKKPLTEKQKQRFYSRCEDLAKQDVEPILAYLEETKD